MFEFNPTFDLSNLNGKNGFVINGVHAGDKSGDSLSTAGDINGDGIADIIIGADLASPGGRTQAGSSYVVFGKRSAWNASLGLSTLDGKNGFVINGVNGSDSSGFSVSAAGDVNSDGVADIIIGAYTASPNGIPYAGTAYVVFGKTTAWNSPLELSTLDGKNGFAINGVASRDFVGASVDTAGDVNGDGIDDIVIGAWDASPGGRTEAGSSYIVFGKKSAWNASLALSTLDGKNGFVINGVTAWSNSGCSVSTAGDVNSDGVADIIIGACTASPNGLTHAGTTYVVFGKTTAWNSPLELSTLDGKNGFAINGVAEGDSSGSSVNTAGDVNADGIVDIIIGAYNASPDGGYYEAGSSYVVFGKKAAWNASLELSALNGKNGFAINGFYNEGFTGISVSTAGDVNRDGIADVIIGSLYATMDSGSSYVVFGKKSAWNASLELLTLNGQNGFVVRGNGTNLGGLGPSVSTAGDINGDGISDILIGTPSALKSAGSSYVVFGQKSELGFFSHRTAAAPESPTVSANLGLKP